MATNKYMVNCPFDQIDVYRVLDLFDVTQPALQHAIKKTLFAGKRGAKNYVQDLREAIQSIEREIDMFYEEEHLVRISLEVQEEN